MKFDFNWPSGFCEKYVLIYIVGTPILATLTERPNVNLDLWNLFIAVASLGLTYQALASTVLKINFSQFFQFQCISKQI